MLRILGLDYGAARIGLALGDSETRLASPWGVLENVELSRTLESLRDLITREQIALIVIGIPYPLRDRTRETEQARAIRSFIVELQKLNVKIVEEDETLSSQLAAQQTRELGQKGKRDDLAAVAILQTYLDREGNPSALLGTSPS